VETWKPEAFEMRGFAPRDADVVDRKAWALGPSAQHPSLSLRRFRLPIAARVRTRDGQPEYLAIDRRGLNGGGVESCAGPWRTSGGWWVDGASPHQSYSPDVGWDRDEWDVTVAGGTTYRMFRARDTDRWFVEGVVD